MTTRTERLCLRCGVPFVPTRNAKGMYCGRVCRNRSWGTAEERFWSYVNKTEACWLWTGGRIGHCGDQYYGGFAPNGSGSTRGAHRYSWELHYGAIPVGLCVLHRCDQPRCVNPEHLFLGTKRDNNRDMAAKGRNARGVQAGRAKLNDDAIREIRRLHALGQPAKGKRGLARQFGVSSTLIQHIVHRRNWTHVADETPECAASMIPRWEREATA